MLSLSNKVAAILSVALISFSLIDCGDTGIDSVFKDEAGLIIRMSSSSMFVTNSTADTIRFFAVEQNASTLIDWSIGCDAMNAVNPKSTKEISYSKISGYHNQCEIQFYWWRCALNSSGRMEPVSLRRMNLKTP